MSSRLLLIDDDLRLTDMVGGYLRSNGFEVDTAGSLAAGRDRLKQALTPYDALLLDLMLPDGDGLDFTRELRSQPRLARAQIDFQAAEGQHLVVTGLGRGAAQERLDTRQQLTRLKGFGQVVVGADFQADDAVHRVTLGRQHQNRRTRLAG